MKSDNYENIITCCLCGKEIKTKKGYYAYPVRPHIAKDGSPNICCEDCYYDIACVGRTIVLQSTVEEEDALSFAFQLFSYEDLKSYFDLLMKHE